MMKIVMIRLLMLNLRSQVVVNSTEAAAAPIHYDTRSVVSEAL